MAEGNQSKERNTRYLESNLRSFFRYMPIMKKAYNKFSIIVKRGDTVDMFINEFIDTDDAHNMGVIVKGFKEISNILGNTLSGNFMENTNPDEFGRKRYYAREVFCGNYHLTSQWIEPQWDLVLA